MSGPTQFRAVQIFQIGAYAKNPLPKEPAAGVEVTVGGWAPSALLPRNPSRFPADPPLLLVVVF